MIVDAHIHVSLFPEREAEALLNLSRGDICADNRGDTRADKQWIMAGYDQSDWLRQIEIKKKYASTVVTCFGLHPWRVLEMTESEIDSQMQWLEQNFSQAQACGETGIDFFRDPNQEKSELQQQVFLRHLAINRKFNKPLVLHCVKAHGPVLDILAQESFTGIVHGFSGSFEVAERYVHLGYQISVGRGIYSKGYKGLKESVKRLPLEALLIESDSSHGDQEHPDKILQKVAETVAEIRSVPVEKVFEVTRQTANEVFKFG